jgi:hypothetical protein
MGKCGLSSAGSVTRIGTAVWLVSLLACFCLSAGCAQQHDNRFAYIRGTLPTPLIKAREPGTYELFAADALSPKFSIDLAAGDLYGFRKREDDAIVAVAKDKEIELGDHYTPFSYWLKKKDAQSK